MAAVQEWERVEVAKLLGELEAETTIVVFGDEEGDCPLCPETHTLAAELAALSPQVTLESHDIALEHALAEVYGIERVPALVLLGPGGWDPGLRFYGIPAGYETATIAHDLLLLSRRDSGLSDESRAALARMERELELKVFVTLTSPYCPRAALIAHQLAIESTRVRASVYEVSEFPDLIDRYRIMGVPKTVATFTAEFEGARPEHAFLELLLHDGASELTPIAGGETP